MRMGKGMEKGMEMGVMIRMGLRMIMSEKAWVIIRMTV